MSSTVPTNVTNAGHKRLRQMFRSRYMLAITGNPIVPTPSHWPLVDPHDGGVSGPDSTVPANMYSVGPTGTAIKETKRQHPRQVRRHTC